MNKEDKYNKPASKLPPHFPPVWACEYGEDLYGNFAVVDLKGEPLKMRWIPPGDFMMGSDAQEADSYKNERPLHQVTLTRGFWLGQSTVTQAQWEAVMGNSPSYFKKNENLPVDSVSWNDCVEFCNCINKWIPSFHASFPTEAQWEYACRAGTVTAFNNGKDCFKPEGEDPCLEEVGWYSENSEGRPHAVKSKLPNAWGLYDMHGNLWEFCLDGKREYSENDMVDPLGPTEDDSVKRVLRGGCWGNGARKCCSASRFEDTPDFRNYDIGFRLVAGQELDFGNISKDVKHLQMNANMVGQWDQMTDIPNPLTETYPEDDPEWADQVWREDEGVFAMLNINGQEFVFRQILPGAFMMGSPESEKGRYVDEIQHRVILSQGYWMLTTPVTQAQWKAVMGDNPSRFKGKDNPVDSVSWHECQKFLGVLNRKHPALAATLPTDAEWEYACRAGTVTAFNNGKDCSEPYGKDPALDEVGWYDKNSYYHTHPVKEKVPNRWGLYDMHANVLEWCLDGMRDFQEDDVVDPMGPTGEFADRMLRGGGWTRSARYCRSASRLVDVPSDRFMGIGFRLVAGHFKASKRKGVAENLTKTSEGRTS